MKAYNSMEAYNFFVFTKLAAGNDKVVVTGRVNHSQQAEDKPLKAWLPAKWDCMTGLCEASYVEALLFVTNAGIRTRESVTCTQEKKQVGNAFIIGGSSLHFNL